MTSCTTSQCGTGLGQITLPNDPDNNILLTASPQFGGVSVDWTLPATNPFAVAYVKIYRSVNNSFNSAVIIANAAGDHYFDRYPWDQNTQVYYWIQTVSINGTVGDVVGPAVAYTSPVIETILEQLTARIDASLLSTELLNEIGRIGLNAADLDTEIAERVSANTTLAGTLNQMQNALDDASTLINSEITNRQEGDTALVYQVNQVAAANASNLALITQDYYTKVDTDTAISSAVTTINAQAGNTKNYNITSRGASATAGSSTVVSEAGVVLGSAGRSYMVTVFNGSTGAHISSTTYDVYGSTAAATTMAAALNALDNTKVVVVSTNDEPQGNRLVNGLEAAMYRCGASFLVFGSSTFKYRAAYILVGIPGSGEGSGIERYAGAADGAADAYCEYNLQLFKGRPVGLGGNPFTAALKINYYTKAAADSAIASAITTSQTTLNGNISSAQTTLQTNINTVAGNVTNIGARYTATVDVNGLVGGFGVYNNGSTVDAGFNVGTFWVGSTSANKVKPFVIDNGTTYIDTAVIKDGTISNAKIGDTIQSNNFSSGSAGWKIWKDGSAEFNGPVISRNIVLASGIHYCYNTQTSFSGTYNATLGYNILTVLVDTGYAADPWRLSDQCLVASAGLAANGVYVWYTNENYLLDVLDVTAVVTRVIPRWKWVGGNTLLLEIQLFLKPYGSVGSFTFNYGGTNGGIAWKLYKVT